MSARGITSKLYTAVPVSQSQSQLWVWDLFVLSFSGPEDEDQPALADSAAGPASHSVPYTVGPLLEPRD